MKRHSRKKLLGTVQKNPRGFAFILPEKKGQSDAYVDKKQARHLLSGDQVEYVIKRSRGRTWADVLRVVKRKKTTLIGQIERLGPHLVLVTREDEWTIPKKAKARENQWAVAEITKYPSKRNRGEVEIRQLLGDQLGPEQDIELAVAEYGLADFFSADVRMELPFCHKKAQDTDEKKKRRDLRETPLVTIDGADAKDFDDAVAVVPGKGHTAFVLYVAIADVSHFVKPESELDREARRRGTSVYFPGFCLPMLPEAISNDLCSLRPKEERFALIAEIHFDREGHVVKSDFYEALIQTHARLTYDEVEGFLNRDPKLLTQYESLSKPIKLLRNLYRVLALQRKKRGTLDFDLPECKIQISSRGEPISVGPAPRFEAHKIIEEFMIAANREVARFFRKTKTTSLFRTHGAPDLEGVDEINQALRALGTSQRLEQNTTPALSKLLKSTEKIRGVAALHTVVLRAQKQALYEAEPNGHFGLALRDYTHFTSPIRRYPDLVVHRSLKRLIAQTKNSDKKYEDDYFAETAAACSALERQAMEAERFVVRRKQCWFLEKKIDQKYEGEISWIDEEGAYVRIVKYAIEGFLPSDSFRDYYSFEEANRSLVQHPGKKRLHIGDRIDIVVEEVSIERQKIWFRQA